MCNCMSNLCVNFLSGAAWGCKMNFSVNSQSRILSFYLNNTKRRCEKHDFSGPIRSGFYAFQHAQCVRWCDTGPGTAWQRDVSEHKLNPDRSALVVSQDLSRDAETSTVIASEALRAQETSQIRRVKAKKKKNLRHASLSVVASRHPRHNKLSSTMKKQLCVIHFRLCGILARRKKGVRKV